MKKYLIAGLLILFCSANFAQNNPVQLEQTQTAWLESENVGDKYLVQCYIPGRLKVPLDSLPLVYVLDADRCFAMTYDIVRWLIWNNEIPQVAVVGTSYATGHDDWWQKRSRDLSISKDTTRIWGEWPLAGRGDDFTKFIEKELFPFLAGEYGLKSKDRTIIGLSFGGLYATDILFSKPEMFSKYIITGPALAWNNRESFKREAAFFSKRKTLPVTVYTAIGSKEYPRIKDPWDDFVPLIKSRSYEGLKLKSEVIEGETHISMFPDALTKGLKFVLNQ